MAYGVMLEQGAQPWQIFQQGPDGTARIHLQGSYALGRLICPPPFAVEPVAAGGVVIRARIVREESGEPVIGWTDCERPADGRWAVVFAAVPAGGLYRIETSLTYEGWDGLSVTRGDMVHCIGVGDIFLIAGQSNACGRAKTPVDDGPVLGVHLLRPSGAWSLACHPLAETTGARYTGHLENHNPGHSPFLHFAKLLQRALGYPIGLLMTPHGGTPLKWWNPDEQGGLFRNMVDMAAGMGVRPRAMLWYQGEAEAYEDGSRDYLARFARFVQASRAALDSPDLPILTVQLNRCLNDDSLEADRHYGLVRQAQRDAMHTLPGVYTVPANDLPLYDTVHLSPEGNLRLGRRLAGCALDALYGRPASWRAPEIVSAVRTGPDAVRVAFEGIENWLDVYMLPPALLPIEAEDAQGIAKVRAYAIEQDALSLTFERPLDAAAVLHGAWRMNPGAAIPQDCGRSPILSFYGFRIAGPEV